MCKKFRFLTVLTVCVMVLSCFSVTAFAYADDTEQNLPVTEATQPEQQPETTPTPGKPKGEPIDDEGNAYTRDLLYDKATNKQFITVQTKNGNTFFIVIDYDAPINEDEEQYQTYFLNMVDESDLLALLDEDTAAALTTCNCKEKCAAGQVNTDCPVCKTNMSECSGTAPVTPEPDKDAEQVVFREIVERPRRFLEDRELGFMLIALAVDEPDPLLNISDERDTLWCGLPLTSSGRPSGNSLLDAFLGVVLSDGFRPGKSLLTFSTEGDVLAGLDFITGFLHEPQKVICGLTAYADTEYIVEEKSIRRTLPLKCNQVLLDESFIRQGQIKKLCGKRRFTLAHECAHQILYQMESDEVKQRCNRQYSARTAYDLWTTEDGKCMVRVKITGEVTEVDRKIMRILRTEEKRLRRSKQGTDPISGTEGKQPKNGQVCFP